MSTTNRCYASVLGGCDSISREHVVTRSLFGDGPVLTSGLRVPPDKPIGIDSLVANILCEKHNSALSPLDSEIKALGDACLAFLKQPQSLQVKVNGPLIERWLLKLAIGSIASGWIHGMKIVPQRDMLEALFGTKQFPQTVGMFGIAGIGRMISRAEDVSFDFFAGQSAGSMGLVSSVHGLPMLLSVCLDAPEQELRAQGIVRDFDVSSAVLRRHPEELMLSSGHESARLSILFDWPN